ncbi:MAG: tripartite tricarboxylate transporter substrate binding protein [Betaproteobacteria bacterium]|nr:tripartite tricarboxylate transporter substrate binding protein [Betaproteobacteria bacterium]
MSNTIRWVAGLCAALCAAAVSAQGYPERPIRLIVPYAPGGNIDITARVIQPGLGELLGQSIIVDNRTGAGGTIGSDIAAKAPADGYTILVGSSGTLTIAPSLYPKNPYNPVRDFAPVSLVSVVPLVFETHPSVPVKNIKEFIALAKSKPGKLTMASSGTGTTNHLAGEMFQSMSGTRFIHVPYKGSGPALVDLMGGQVDFIFDQLSSSASYIKAGKLRALAVCGEKRAAILPDLPTVAESGVPGFEATTVTGLVVPAGTPRDIINKLHAATVKVMARPAVKERFASFGAEAISSTPEAFGVFIKQDFAKWTKVVKDANIQVE